MSRTLALGAGVAVLALVVVAVLLLGSGGEDGSGSDAAPPEAVEAPETTTPPSSDLGALPPGFAECMAEQGYEIASQADIHSAPPEVLQACFGAAH
jgi:hypothetical protein